MALRAEKSLWSQNIPSLSRAFIIKSWMTSSGAVKPKFPAGFLYSDGKIFSPFARIRMASSKTGPRISRQHAPNLLDLLYSFILFHSIHRDSNIIPLEGDCDRFPEMSKQRKKLTTTRFSLSKQLEYKHFPTYQRTNLERSALKGVIQKIKHEKEPHVTK